MVYSLSLVSPSLLRFRLRAPVGSTRETPEQGDRGAVSKRALGGTGPEDRISLSRSRQILEHGTAAHQLLPLSAVRPSHLTDNILRVGAQLSFVRSGVAKY